MALTRGNEYTMEIAGAFQKFHDYQKDDVRIPLVPHSNHLLDLPLLWHISTKDMSFLTSFIKVEK